MYQTFDEIVEAARKTGPYTISVAVAEDIEVLKALKLASDAGICTPILVGDAEIIKSLLDDAELPRNTPIVDIKDPSEASLKAVELVRNDEADLLMKGHVNTSVFMKAVLNKEKGLRTGNLLSHMATYQIPGESKLTFCSDSGINVAPDLDQKKQILGNALNALKAMGFEKPKVAALAANELVNPKIPATVDAKELMDMVHNGVLPDCIIEGPIAMDVATSKEAAEHKGIDSEVAGDVDLFFFPTIEVGNVLGKAWLYYCNAKWAGVVLGAKKPIVLGSRTDTAEIKLNSIAMACLASQ